MPLATCPGKVSASALNEAEHGFTYFAAAEPAFLGKNGLTPAERGTATHRFAEVCDFQNAQDDLEAEMRRLQNAGYLRKEECDVLDRETLTAFLQSDLLARMQAAEAIYREQKFTVLFPANAVVSTLGDDFPDEQITVQGIIDCAFVENWGREKGILAGANVVMPNLSPVKNRKLYELYDNKICTGEEAAECRGCLSRRVESVGYRLVEERGDWRNNRCHTK